MSKSIFSALRFNDEAAAYAYLEALIWADGRVCPHCGVIDRSALLKGKSGRIGLYKCYACRKPFTVKIGTIFEDSHIAMRNWLTAIHLICSSKKGVSANQLHRTLGITLKSAWFLGHRIREAMRTGNLAPMGSVGGIVEADETFIGRKEGSIKRRGHGHKNTVLSLIDRNTKQVRSFHIDGTSAADVMPIIRKNVAKETAMMTDEGGHYSRLGSDFASHESVQHKADEYVRGDVHTNTVEGYLHRYIAEFDFRYNNRAALCCGDQERSSRALEGVKGGRLTYQTSGIDS